MIRKTTGMLGGLLCLGLAAFSAPVLAKVQQESIFFYEIAGSAPNETLQLVEDGSFKGNCVQHNHPGCVNVPKYYTGLVGFVLEGSNRQCMPGDDAWKLDSVRIGGVDRLSNPQPKPESWGKLETREGKGAASDFGANRETGVVRHQTRKRFPHALWILNANWHLVSTWYQVSAVHCSDPTRRATAEGRIDNRGQ